MPPKKKKQMFTGIYYALRFHPKSKSFITKRRGIFSEEELDVLIKLTREPFLFHESCRESELVESFIKIYTRRPNEALAFMLVISQILKQWSNAQAGKVI